MKIKSYNQYKTLRKSDLEELAISGNTSEDSECCVTALKSEAISNIYTSDNSYLTKFKKLIEINPDAWKITQVVERSDGTISGVMLRVPKKFISFRAVERVGRVMTDEEKTAAAERLRALRSNK